MEQSVFVGPAGGLGLGVAVVVYTRGCDTAAQAGTVTCNRAPPSGAASCRADSVTAPAVAVEVSIAVLTWPVIVAGAEGAGPSATSGIVTFAPMGTPKAIVGLYVTWLAGV